jgi:hypothetical protein
MKYKCKQCNRTKTARNFSYRKTVCNKCYKEGDSYAKERDRYLTKTYGITLAEYNQILADQSGGCAICGGQSGGKNLAVDHNHKNGAVRGLLCKRHNSALARWIRDASEAFNTWHYLNEDGSRVREILARDVVVPEQTK